MELETWVEVFRKEPDEDVIVSIVEAAGTRAGWQLPAENLFNLLALSKEREAEATPETPSPRRRRRRANP